MTISRDVAEGIDSRDQSVDSADIPHMIFHCRSKQLRRKLKKLNLSLDSRNRRKCDLFKAILSPENGRINLSFSLTQHKYLPGNLA